MLFLFSFLLKREYSTPDEALYAAKNRNNAFWLIERKAPAIGDFIVEAAKSAILVRASAFSLGAPVFSAILGYNVFQHIVSMLEIICVAMSMINIQAIELVKINSVYPIASEMEAAVETDLQPAVLILLLMVPIKPKQMTYVIAEDEDIIDFPIP